LKLKFKKIITFGFIIVSTMGSHNVCTYWITFI